MLQGIRDLIYGLQQLTGKILSRKELHIRINAGAPSALKNASFYRIAADAVAHVSIVGRF
jgi:hypothetical protein